MHCDGLTRCTVSFELDGVIRLSSCILKSTTCFTSKNSKKNYQNCEEERTQLTVRVVDISMETRYIRTARGQDEDERHFHISVVCFRVRVFFLK